MAILTRDPLHSSRKLPAIPCTAHFVAPYTEHLAYVRSPATDEMNTTYNRRCQQYIVDLFYILKVSFDT